MSTSQLSTSSLFSLFGFLMVPFFAQERLRLMTLGSFGSSNLCSQKRKVEFRMEREKEEKIERLKIKVSIETNTLNLLLFIVFGGLRFGDLRPSANPVTFALWLW